MNTLNLSSLRAILAGMTLFTASHQAAGYCITTSLATCPQSTTGGWPGATTLLHANGYAGSNSTFNSAFVDALSSWNGLSNFHFTHTNNAADPCDPGYGDQGWEFDDTYCGTSFGSATLAVTTTWASTFAPAIGTITDSDITFNSTKSWGVHNDDISEATVDFRRVATHELGHLLGLGHDSTYSALMNPYYGNILIPVTDDINGLIALYGEKKTAAQTLPPIYLLLLDE